MKNSKVWISCIAVLAVTVVVLFGCGSKAGPAPVATAPADAPSGVTATPGNGQVTIAWTAVAGATSYHIFWATTPGVTTANGTRITSTNIPYIQTGLATGTTYYYVVTAVNSVGETVASAQASTTPPLSTPAGPFIQARFLGLAGGSNPLGRLQQVS